MAKSVNAVDIIMLFRIEGEQGDAWKLGLQTDATISEARSYETTETKDGSTKTAGAYEGTHSITSFLAEDDVYVAKLRELIRERNPKNLEVWEINRTNLTNSSELDGHYSLDSVVSVEISAGSEGSVEVSIETEINNTPKAGKVQVTPKLLQILQTITEDQSEFKQPIEGGDDDDEGGA